MVCSADNLSVKMKNHKQRQRRTLLLVTALTLVGIACLITGIVLLAKRESCEKSKEEDQHKGKNKASDERCSYSEEAKRCGLDRFLEKVQATRFTANPFLIAYKTGVTVDEVKLNFKPYDPSALKLKSITDDAKGLLKELAGKSIDKKRLKPRERKALAQVKHYLQHTFGTPFDGNYYSGDFLLGPNVFCWQPICDVGYHIQKNLPYFKPSDTHGLETVIRKLSEVNKTFVTYTDNLKYGIKAGMVRTSEECKAGLDAIRRRYFNISLHGPTGVFNESFVKAIISTEFLSSLQDKADQLQEWSRKYRGKTVVQSLQEAVLEHIGQPVYNLLRFLETEHMQHCAPSNVSSGLSFLPLDFVYVNGSANNKTTKILPTGEPLNGSQAYLDMLSFFTTTNITPDEVHGLGFKMLSKLYPEALEVVRHVTGQRNNDTVARDEFLRNISAPEMFFSDGVIPKDESDDNAYKLCSSAQGAIKHCPARWKAIQQWFKETREVMSKLDPKTSKLFYFTGDKHTAPNCPLDVQPNFNPSAGVPSYRRSDRACSKNAVYFIPFFLEKPGPRYMQWSVNAHEARPGHHTQAQGLMEHFQDTCGGVIGWLSSVTSYTAFVEGWALYAENPLIAYDTDTYKGQPLYKYGMLKSQVWRALRMIIDTGLHYKGFTREKSLELFDRYLWDNSDITLKEVTRYQSVPGQATSYMIGQLQIMKLRDYVMKELGSEFNMKDFHLQVLFQGSAPLNYLQEHIKEYVDCMKNKNKEGCDETLNPVAKVHPSLKNSENNFESMDSISRELYF